MKIQIGNVEKLSAEKMCRVTVVIQNFHNFYWF
jgi:hypothetical protein